MKFEKPGWPLIILFLVTFFIPVQAEIQSVLNRIMIRNDRAFFTNFAFIIIGLLEVDDEEKVVSI